MDVCPTLFDEASRVSSVIHGCSLFEQPILYSLLFMNTYKNILGVINRSRFSISSILFILYTVTYYLTTCVFSSVRLTVFPVSFLFY